MTNLNLKFLKNLSLSELGLWLLIPFASLTSHTWLPLPPTMLLFFGAIVCWIILQFNNERSKIENQKMETSSHAAPLRNVVVVVGLFALYIFVSQYFINAGFRHYMGAMLAPLYLIFILLLSENITSDFLKKLGQKFIHYSLVILCVEAILRYGISFYLISQNANFFQGFYQFKFEGPMYETSNVVACHLVSLLFFTLWWARTYKQSMKKELFLFFILIVLTLSRASVPAVAIGLLYYCFFKNLNWKKSLFVLFSLFCVALLSLLILKNLFDDGSFQSKFLIFDEALEYYKTANLKQVLFGIGFYESGNFMTYYAHNYFLMFLMEAGVFGLIFLCATFFIFVKASNGLAMIVMLPFVIQTSAESVPFLPYFYVAMSFLILFSNKKITT